MAFGDSEAESETIACPCFKTDSESSKKKLGVSRSPFLTLKSYKLRSFRDRFYGDSWTADSETEFRTVLNIETDSETESSL